MHLLLIANTVASSVTDRRLGEVERRLATGHDLDIVTTTHRGHATEIAAAAVSRGIGAVVVLGGDGTLNEAANALVGTDRILAPLPGGSTNVFARSIGLPRDVADAASVTAAALGRGSVERIGVGEVTADGGPPRAFLCHTGIGWDAALVSEVERRREGARRRATIPLFTRAGLHAFTKGYDRRNPQFSVGPFADDRSDDDRVITYGRFALVMNSDPYTFLGRRPFRVAPAADRHSGLAVVTMSNLNTPTFLRTVLQALGGRGIHPGRGTDVRSGITALSVDRLASATGEVHYQVDGDHLGAFEHLAFRYRPAALDVINPSGAAP